MLLERVNRFKASLEEARVFKDFRVDTVEEEAKNLTQEIERIQEETQEEEEFLEAKREEVKRKNESLVKNCDVD